MVSQPLFYYVFLGVSLFFLTLTKDARIAGIFLVALFVDFAIFQQLPTSINQNQIPKNTGTALTFALVAFAIFIGVTFVVTAALQGTAFLQGTIDPENPIQSILRHGFASTGLSEDDPILSIRQNLFSAEDPIFADSIILTYLEFGIVIAFIETRLIIRIWEFLSKGLNIPLGKFSTRMFFVMFIVSAMFMFFHSEVKGVQDNVANLMTFIFAFISLEFARRTREMEGATYFHIINNIVFIWNRIGF